MHERKRGREGERVRERQRERDRDRERESWPIRYKKDYRFSLLTKFHRPSAEKYNIFFLKKSVSKTHPGLQLMSTTEQTKKSLH